MKIASNKIILLPVMLLCFALGAGNVDWLIAEKDKQNTEFDVFYIHPTLLKDKKNPFPDFSNQRIRKRLKKFSADQTGIFGNMARVFVPAVRQVEYLRVIKDMDKYGVLDIPENSLRYPAVADTVTAFREYLEKFNPGGKRPYILFGHSQGAMDLYELMRKVPEISPEKGFVAAYIPGLPQITAEKIRTDLGKRNIFPAEDEGSTGVVISWNTQSVNCIVNLFTVKNGYGINPLNWRTDDLAADSTLHRGMILYNHKTGSPLLYMYRNAQPASCTAKLQNGALIVDKVHPGAEKLFCDKNGSYHAGDIWMFTGNIVENAALRVKLYRMKNALDSAKKMIKNNQAECVVVKDGKIVKIERGRGVSPLLRLYDREKEIMKNAVIVDKVIGRAAAMIAICGKAEFVHGRIMSEDAQSLLKDHNIASSCELKVKRILNRKRDGLCPLEKSVEGITDPEKALAAMRKKIAQLMKGVK